MNLLEQLDLTPGDCVAVVGAGGKTTLCWRLVQQMSSRGERVIFTTTTHIRQPAPGAFDIVEIVQEGGDVESLISLSASYSWRTACIASAVVGQRDDTPVPGSCMPAVHTRLTGFSSDAICNLRAGISNPRSPVSFVVEADGARGRWLKAPAEHEPVIPPCATVACVVANMRALGQPLDERVAHRPEHIAQLTGAQMGQPITPQLIINLLTHPLGGLKGMPPGARKVAVLAQHASAEPAEAGALASALTARGFDQVLLFNRT